MSFSHRISWTIDCTISYFSHTLSECLIRIQKHFTIQKNTFIEVEFDCHASWMSDLQHNNIIIPINFNERDVCRRECCLRFTEGTYILHTSDLDRKQTLLTRCTTYSSFSCLMRQFLSSWPENKAGFWVSMTVKSSQFHLCRSFLRYGHSLFNSIIAHTPYLLLHKDLQNLVFKI